MSVSDGGGGEVGGGVGGFFFFKQKTAYEIYQCDWSSDVCSSDLSFSTVCSPLSLLNSTHCPPSSKIRGNY